MKTKFSIFTYGCQMNKYDSEIISGLLINDLGGEEVYNFKEADIIVVNTCSVRQHAENRALSKIGILEKLKKEGAILCVVGCMAQRLKDKLFKKFKGVDILVGPNQISNITSLIKTYKNNKMMLLNDEETTPKIEPNKICRENNIKAYVTISFGCDRSCSYCIVPYVRGRSKDRPPEEIINEVKLLSNKGYKEVCLLGQSVGSYGKKIHMPFYELLEQINKINGSLKRIRFITMHPKDLTDEVINKMQLDKICPSIHLPLQAGSNKILKKMRRGYTIEYYKDLIKKLREKIKEISITTDIIVGFPGEDEQDYNMTLSALCDIEFDAAFLFKYSAREGTLAYKLEDTVPEKEKLRRLNEVISLQKKISEKVNKRYINKELLVLVEGENKLPSKLNLYGTTENDKIVFFEGPKELITKEVKVKIEEAHPHCLKGKIIG